MFKLNDQQQSMLDIIDMASTNNALESSLSVAFNDESSGIKYLRDFRTVGFHLPQRSGISLLAAYLINRHVIKYSSADYIGHRPKALYIGPQEINPRLFPGLVQSPLVTSFCNTTGANYKSVVSLLAKELRPNIDDNYSLIVVDSANWIAESDTRFMELLKAIYCPDMRPLPLLVYFSS